MCWPSCKGGAYLSISVFVYRSVMVIITMISSSITGYKSSYLPITAMEELLLQLIYFIPLFTSSCFILIGLESNSFNYIFYSTLALGWTLFIRYFGELTFIYAQGWNAYKIKLPQLYLYLGVDLCLLFVLLLYARNRLRSKSKKRQLIWKNSRDIYNDEVIEYGVAEGDGLIHNDLGLGISTTKNINVEEEDSRKIGTLKNGNIAPVLKGLGPQGVDPNSIPYYHYPPFAPIDPQRAKKPLPPLPKKDELDDVSLPPPVPLACPDEDDD